MDDTIQKFEKLLSKKYRTHNKRTPSEIGKASKIKGKSGERFFANTLTQLTNMSFIRVPNSGAFVGLSNRERLKILSRTQSLINLGDIICPENLYYYFIFESKNYKTLDFHNILNTNNSMQLKKWLNELLYDIESAYMYITTIKPVLGFLCIKITNKGNWIVGNVGNIITHYNTMTLPTPHLYFNHEIPQLLYNYNFNTTFFMCDFVSFITNNIMLFTKTINNSV